jgi:hypothetical protein
MRVAAGVVPAFSVVVILATIGYCYVTARQHGHVPPFPKTDITHTLIKYPEYLAGRVGFISITPLIALSYYILMAYLNKLSFLHTGEADPHAGTIFHMGWVSAVAFCFGTAAVSDGKTDGKNDMNWLIHDNATMLFFVLQLLAIHLAGRSYARLGPNLSPPPASSAVAVPI